MKKFIIPIIFISFFTACSKNVYNPTCCELTSIYKMYDCNCSVYKAIDVAGGYEQMAKSIFIDKKVNEFTYKVDRYVNDLYYTRKVDNPYISRYCRAAKQISSQDLNETDRSNALATLMDEWIKGYRKQLTKDIRGKLKFNRLDGCDTEADALDNLVRDKSGTHINSEEHYKNVELSYQDCLYMKKQKQERDVINKLNKNIGGNDEK